MNRYTEPKLYYCEECKLDFSSKDDNKYEVTCPYCNEHLNKEMLNGHYQVINMSNKL